ncbi:MAG: four helix bundle protein [Bacteroidota bacterium]
MVGTFRDLRVYRAAFTSAMRLFETSKSWPKSETYALTDQVRRSSRAVCANLAEAWAKRRYRKHFVSKLTDAEAEANETRSWLEFAVHSGYMSREEYEALDREYDRLIGGLVRMRTNPDPWCGPAGMVREPAGFYDTNDPSEAED